MNGHKQIQKCVTFKLVGAVEMLERVQEAEEEVYGYANGTDADLQRMKEGWKMVQLIDID